MNLNDLPRTYDDPVEALLGFHRRIERSLAALAQLPCTLEATGPDAATTAAAAGLVDFFSRSLQTHHADEAELLRLLEPRARGSSRDWVEELRGRVDAEHHEMDRAWRALLRPLRAIAEGVSRGLPLDLVHYFRTIHSAHIAFEESALHLEAVRRLSPVERSALARGMAARRTRAHRLCHGFDMEPSRN
jgi:hemerythrin-like domain-containing protein